MIATAKVFTTGNSQAIRLPKAFRVDVAEVWITKDERTGAITLHPKDDDQRKKNLDELFRLIREEPFTEEFIPARGEDFRPDPFAEWETTGVAGSPMPAGAAKRTKRVAKKTR